MVVSRLLPNLRQPLAAEFEITPKLLSIAAFVKSLTRAVIQGGTHNIFKFVADDLLVVERHTLSVLGLKFRWHTFAQSEK
ncbi:MAG: hypothetical protein A2X90_05240 [Deltaproteobacteria bacterium GWA2_65_63]|nr:MAG: hypothetical protein A2X90_05240 [Deltaproteobacteria bacterium GWA2_65_63]